MSDLGTAFFESGTDTLIDEDASDVYTNDTESGPASPFKEDVESPPSKARESGEDLIAFAFMGIGGVLVNKGIDKPVGRCVLLEAPLLGKKIDEVIAGTFIDKLLQPLFRAGDGAQELGAMLALPVMAGIMERKPEMAPMLAEPFAAVLRESLTNMAPLMRKKKNATRRAVRALGDEFNESFDIPKGEDPVPYIIQNFIFQEQFEEVKSQQAAYAQAQANGAT